MPDELDMARSVGFWTLSIEGVSTSEDAAANDKGVSGPIPGDPMGVRSPA